MPKPQPVKQKVGYNDKGNPPFKPATKAPSPGTIRKSTDTITRFEDKSAVRNKNANYPKAQPAPLPLRAKQPGTPAARAYQRANQNASFKRTAAPAPKGGGIDLPKFAGEVGRNLDRVLPTRNASNVVKGAMQAPSVRGGNAIGVTPTDPVSAFFKAIGLKVQRDRK